MSIDFTQRQWINPPQDSRITPEFVKIVTDPGTDFWQRSYYGFRNDNAPALLVESAVNFTFTTTEDLPLIIPGSPCYNRVHTTSLIAVFS